MSYNAKLLPKIWFDPNTKQYYSYIHVTFEGGNIVNLVIPKDVLLRMIAYANQFETEGYKPDFFTQPRQLPGVN